MPAATNKTDLLAVTVKDYDRLRAVMDQVPSRLALVKDADNTSIKDVIAHRAHWTALFFGWYRDGQADKDVVLPAQGYKWNDLKRYNADLRAAQAGISWQEACHMLDTTYAELIASIEELDDAALYGEPMKGGKSKWTTGRWAEAAGASHYRSATKYLRARLRAG